VTTGANFKARVESELDLSDADPAWLEMLEQVVAALDTIASLEELTTADGLTTPGSRGQLTMHPAVAELRQQRAAVARLLEKLGLGEPTDPVTFRDRQRAAALARWRGK
jgi:hypothetical protein